MLITGDRTDGPTVSSRLKFKYKSVDGELAHLQILKAGSRTRSQEATSRHDAGGRLQGLLQIKWQPHLWVVLAFCPEPWELLGGLRLNFLEIVGEDGE